MKNFTNLKFCNFVVLSSNCGTIQGKMITAYLYVSGILCKSNFKMSQVKLKYIHYSESYTKFKKSLKFCPRWQNVGDGKVTN